MVKIKHIKYDNFYWKNLNKNYNFLSKKYFSYIFHSIDSKDFKSYDQFMNHFVNWFGYDSFMHNFFKKYFKDYPITLSQIEYWNDVEKNLEKEVDEYQNKSSLMQKTYEFLKYIMSEFFVQGLKSKRFLGEIYNKLFVFPLERQNKHFTDLDFLSHSYIDELKLFFLMNKQIKGNYIRFVMEPQMFTLKEKNKFFSSFEIDSINLNIEHEFIKEINNVEEMEKINNGFKNMIYLRDFVLCYLVFNEYYVPYFNVESDSEYVQMEIKFKESLNEFVSNYIIDRYDNLDIINELKIT